MKHVVLTQARFLEHRQTVIDGERAARRLLDVVSPSINATDGSITDRQRSELLRDADRTRIQLAYLVEALELREKKTEHRRPR